MPQRTEVALAIICCAVLWGALHTRLHHHDVPAHATCRCSGAVVNKCTAEHNYGGCWQATIDKVLYHNCVDTFQQYRSLAVHGALNASSKAFTCGACPPCFAATADGKCAPTCDLKRCNPQTGLCVSQQHLPSGGCGCGGPWRGLHAHAVVVCRGECGAQRDAAANW